MLNSKYKQEIRGRQDGRVYGECGGFLDKSPSVHDIERVVEQTEASKLLSYYNKHKHMLNPSQQSYDAPNVQPSLESVVKDTKMTERELEPANTIGSHKKADTAAFDEERLIEMMNQYENVEQRDTQ